MVYTIGFFKLRIFDEQFRLALHPVKLLVALLIIIISLWLIIYFWNCESVQDICDLLKNTLMQNVLPSTIAKMSITLEPIQIIFTLFYYVNHLILGTPDATKTSFSCKKSQSTSSNTSFQNWGKNNWKVINTVTRCVK